MKSWQLDHRTRENIIAQIGELAAEYTPEWRFDPVHPDAGSTLALLFADMFADTIRRCNQIPEKCRREFFSELGVTPAPSVPAEGYVTFAQSSDEFGGSRIPKGTIVMAEGTEGENVEYETCDPLYVTPAKLCHAIFVDGQEDYIGIKDWSRPFLPFGHEEKNCQEHAFYLCHREVLGITPGTKLFLTIEPYRRDEDLGWLSDEDSVSIAYKTETGFEEFSSRRLERGVFILTCGDGQPDAAWQEMFGMQGYWICFRHRTAWHRKPFVVRDVRLAAEKEQIPPNLVQTDEGEQEPSQFYPFGADPAPSGTCYLAATEVLGKPGARVRLTFSLDYERVPFDNSVPVEPRWKVLMKRSDFVPDPEYDITVEQVVWEYFNGDGWSRLPLSGESQKLFNGTNAAQEEEIEMEFVCPPDAALLNWQSAPERYLRVRVLRMNNLYKLKGAYIVPVIANVRFRYAYPCGGVHPLYAVTCNQMEQIICLNEKIGHKIEKYEVFYPIKRQNRCLYLGFDRPVDEGPVRLFCSVRETDDRVSIPLAFSYSGGQGFEPLATIDETGGLRQSGLLTIPGKEDFRQIRVCGQSAYWICITDERTSKTEMEEEQPKIMALHRNTVRVRETVGRLPEYFEVMPGEVDKRCKLLRENIHELAVWVDEQSVLSPEEYEMLRRERRIAESGNEDGEPVAIWVRWEETMDFAYSASGDRHYVLDRTQGVVQFSDGKQCMAPPAGAHATIRIEYSCGGGLQGNQAPGGVNRLGSSLGYVNRVINYEAVCGGHDVETVEQALLRGAKNLRHSGRAVTASDYEALAHEASRSVLRVKCYPGYRSDGSREPGSITLVVLQKNFVEGHMYFDGIRRRIQKEILGRAEGNLSDMRRLYVTEPQFMRMDCYVKIVISDAGFLFEMPGRVEEGLRRFLDPITGNYDGKGWEIGTVPNDAQLASALTRIPGVQTVRELRIALRQDAGKKRGCGKEQFVVVLSGQHKVSVEVEDDSKYKPG